MPFSLGLGQDGEEEDHCNAAPSFSTACGGRGGGSFALLLIAEGDSLCYAEIFMDRSKETRKGSGGRQPSLCLR